MPSTIIITNKPVHPIATHHVLAVSSIEKASCAVDRIQHLRERGGREGGREGGKDGEREGGREGGREGVREVGGESNGVKV